MSLHYQTECRIGARRVHRSYTGYQAVVAIMFDLIFGLLFELVAAVAGPGIPGSSASRFISWFTP